MVEERGVYRVLVGKPEGRRPLGRPRHIWVDNIRMAPPRDCKTLMMVVGLVWSNESWSYAGGSIATGRASHARLVRDEDPD